MPSVLLVILSLAMNTTITFQAPGQTAPSPKAVAEAIEGVIYGRAGGSARKAAAMVRALAAGDDLRQGMKPRYEDDVVVFAIEAPQGVPAVVARIGTDDTLLPMTKLDKSLYTAVFHTQGGEPGFPTGILLEWKYQVGEHTLGSGHLETYPHPPDLNPDPSVPKGTLTQQPMWKSHVFPGTERDWWLYVPAQYTADRPACVMVFQDGAAYKDVVPTVFDHLIAAGEMPVTVGIFIQPGTLLPAGPDRPRGERSFEYDTLSDQYARFLLEEILPEVEKQVRLKRDAASRAIAGMSSGGICAFTVAWQRPDQFGKVLSWIGSFANIAGGPTQIEGGHNYEALIRRTPRKPIRVFLQDGRTDLDNEFGDWPLANQGMAKALAYAKYDVKFIFGYGGHSAAHGISLLPNSLRWLWRDYPK